MIPFMTEDIYQNLVRTVDKNAAGEYPSVRLPGSQRGNDRQRAGKRYGRGTGYRRSGPCRKKCVRHQEPSADRRDVRESRQRAERFLQTDHRGRAQREKCGVLKTMCPSLPDIPSNRSSVSSDRNTENSWDRSAKRWQVSTEAPRKAAGRRRSVDNYPE